MSVSMRGQISPAGKIEMLRRMMLVRAFDSLLPDLYAKQLIRGSSHSAIGQEAVAVGACAALAPIDYITSTHRGHGHTIAKGGDVKKMMAELLGREDGYCRGKGGSMHIADFSIGMLGANGIVGGGFGIAAGAALSAQLRRSGQVALCFFGDGAINQGAFHGAANLAGIWKLPLILLCENNQFAMSGRAELMIAGGDPVNRASAYGLPGVSVDGMDVIAVYDAVAQARQRAQAGDGSTLIVAACYRFQGHFSGDAQKYRTRDELAQWLERDPIEVFRGSLTEQGLLSTAQVEAMEEGVKTEIQRALDFAVASPWPEPGEAWEDVDA